MKRDEALAEAWASIDGKLEQFRNGKDKPVLEQPGGHYDGYVCEAQEMIDRLRARGYALVPIEPTDAMITAAIYCDHDGTVGGKLAAQHKAMIEASDA